MPPKLDTLATNGDDNLKTMLTNITVQVNKIDSLIVKVDNAILRLDNLEEKYKTLNTKFVDLEHGFEHMEEENEGMKGTVEKCVVIENMIPVYKKMADLSNRNRRNNIVISNVPESYVGDDREALESFVQDIATELGITRKIEIERVHRNPPWKKPAPKDPPRKIVVKFLRYKDREEIL